MSVGLIALLDDVALIARAAAASLDDVAAQAGKAGTKVAGVVIDDAAVTPGYVTGFSASRELPMILRIARGSLFNKLVILAPAALLLSAVAPWVVTPLLMLGGLYLAYEGAEKVWEKIAPHAAHAHEAETGQAPEAGAESERALEEKRVRGAVKTDFILSAEIMAITLASVSDAPLLNKALVLVAVGVLITAAVYGAVALIVKADDVGLALVRRGGAGVRIGRAMVAGMPAVLTALAGIGTVAMLWVGGGILAHGLAEFGWHGVEHALEEAARGAEGFRRWAIMALGSGLFGLAVGAAVIVALTQGRKLIAR